MNLPLLFSALALIICIVSLIYLKSYLKRRTGQKRILAEFQEEVNDIIKSINETTDRDISLIEERKKTLNKLLEEIEKRLKTYIREMERFGNAKDDRPVFSPAIPEKKQVNPTYQELGKNRRRLSRPSQTAEPEQTLSPSFPLPDFNIKAETNSSPPKSEQIRSLLQSGFSAQMVASRLGISIAEVEFWRSHFGAS